MDPSASRMHWPSRIAALEELDQAQAFPQLSCALAQLPAKVPPRWQPLLHYLQGKCALVEQAYPQALQALARCVQHQPRHAHAHYLMGVALARQQRWLDAATSLQRALELDPGFQPAALELVQVALTSGDLPMARACLDPLWHRADASPEQRSAAWCLRLQQVPLDQVPGQLREALAQPQRLPDQLLLAWIQAAGAWLLVGEWAFAAQALRALATPSPSLEACGHPLPRRPALTLALMAALLQADGSAAAVAEELRSCYWLPPAQAEAALWYPLIRPALELLIGRLQGDGPPPAEERGALVVLAAVIRALAPPDEHQLPQLIDALQAQPARNGPLSPLARLALAQHDLPAQLELWPQLLALSDQQWHASRRGLDQGLLWLSALLLDRPQRLVRQSQPAALQRAQQLRQRGLALLEAAHQRLNALMPPLPTHGRARRHWLLLASDDLPQCWLYRVEQKQQQLQALGCHCRIVNREQLDSWDWSEQLLWADAVVVCRLPALHPVLRAIHAARRAGLSVYYDLDDLLFDAEHCPPPLASYGGTLPPELHRRFQLDVPLYAAAIRACDGLIASTDALAHRWRHLQRAWGGNQPVWVLPNLAPPALRAALQAPPRRLRGKGPLRLVVASGTTAHKQCWHGELAPALAVLLERHPQLQLDLLGHLPLPLVLQPHAARIVCRPYSDYATYVQFLRQGHIGLVVLEEGPFTDAKSAIRWMEFSHLGLAAVLSPTATYRQLLVPGRHALFARGTHAWVCQIERLMNDPQLRLQLARAAQQHAQNLFGPQQAEHFWRPLLDPPASPAGPAHKLLVAHVLFAPQALGGATRVVQEHVQALLEHQADRYAVTVLCSDHSPWQGPAADPLPPQTGQPWAELAPIPVEIHNWHGARVVRLALPNRPWREHQDASMRRLCGWWLAQEGFDLIHAHCLQVLSVAPLQVARQLGIPYGITLHDGWWLSPRQFLITASGAPVDPTDPCSHHDHPDQQPPLLLQQDRERRRELEQVLADAAARWAVSEAFARLHVDAGIAGVAVWPNRWQPMPAPQAPQPRPADQPLRACFVGGLSLHKGLAVLQAALLQADLPAPGLQLTLVDASLDPGDTYTLTWGSVPVQVVAAVPMQAMAAFYANHDVLLAPSIWPESYGLVTREALSAGLWVVASDAGALAEPIRPGWNGHVVPPRDPAALAAVLEQLCAQHPSPRPLLAFDGDQPPLAIELDRHYGVLLEGSAG